MSFKRASLSSAGEATQPTRVGAPSERGGSAEVFRPTTELALQRPAPWELAAPRAAALVLQVSSIPSPDGHLYRLTDEEVEVLLQALQHAKFPHSYERLPKPALEEFEQLESLRQKLAEQRGGGV